MRNSKPEIITMQDLPAVHSRLEPQLSEAIMRVVESGVYIRGREVESLENELAYYAGSSSVRTCANGTEALQIALMALDLKPDDEVITTTFSFIASAEVCALLRIKVVFADIDPRTYNIDPRSVEKLVTPRTRVIIPVHLFGAPADMESIMRIARHHNLYVVEDNAQSFGAETTVDSRRRKLGSIGTIGCTSFFPTKNLGCMGDGGAIFTSDAYLAEKIKTIASHGAAVKYNSTMVGVNSRLDAIQAAVLRIKLRHLDEFISRRRGIALKYRAGLKGNDFIVLPEMTDGHTFNQFTLRVNYGCRDDLQAYLKARGIQTMIYFPVPIHRQPVFKAYNNIDIPVADKAASEVLSLPMHSEMTDEDINTIIETLNSFEIGKK